MYIASNGEFNVISPLYVETVYGDSIPHPNLFECDSLMVPIITKLNRKGYKTTACCQGHIASHTVEYPYEDSKHYITLGKYRDVSAPYIYFFTAACDHALFGDAFDDLPNEWYTEMYSIDDNEVITTIDQFNRATCTAYSITLNMGWVKKEYTDLQFYSELIKHLMDLEAWVDNLPAHHPPKNIKGIKYTYKK